MSRQTTRRWLDISAWHKNKAQSFSALSPEQVYGAIAYDWRHREAVDTSMKKAQEKGNALRQDLRRQDPAFYERLARVKEQKQAAKAWRLNFKRTTI